MPYTTTTRVTYVHQNDKMCFRDPERKHYYHQEIVPVRQVAHGHHDHHHHHHHNRSSSQPRVSYHSSTTRYSASPRVSTSSYRHSSPVVYQERLRETRYR
ncbi:hypothetical protein F4809DRAFT_119456 [Biscogniauxia mediterranea]|nr:hypothetical protein F4809DRAFT_119456 [Biscogniauxia mediterranea]